MCVLLYKIVACHMFGDYILQNDFIASTKGNNWWHMFVHCITYTIPFTFIFKFDWRIAFLFVTHFVIDNLKARWHRINYVSDQALHLLSTIVYFY